MPAPKAVRHRPVRELGRGGMGAVELVWDAQREENVAKKRANRTSPREAARIKREFRVAAELDHPSLLRVIELGQDEEGPWFTMEALDAVDLRTACRGRETVVVSRSGVHSQTTLADDATLDEQARTVVGQLGAPSTPLIREGGLAPRAVLANVARYLPPLLEGLGHLHARGLVHRDLKPSNVLVTTEGRVVVLDYGILAEVTRSTGEVIGTPPYMAPEQLRGAPPNPATDRYALGVVLHELLSGVLPFSASGFALIVAHLEERPAELPDHVPIEIRALVGRLLSKGPQERPLLAEVARVLTETLGARPAIVESDAFRAGALLGRETLQRRLDAARPSATSRFQLWVLEGPTGVGKTALARWLVEQHAALGGHAVLGRARGSELVPFNAVDAAIGELSRLLTEDERKSKDGALAASVFPVLAGASTETTDVPRVVALEAVAALTAKVAARGGLIWSIDDLQWADADSLALLDALARARPSGLLILATLRSDVEATEASRWLELVDTVDRHEVPPLDASASRALIDRVLAAERTVLPDDAVDALAAQCQGRPFFAEAAGRLAARRPERLARGIEAVLGDELGDLASASRRALAVLYASGGWSALGDVAAHAGERLGETDRLIDALVRSGIVRRSGARGEAERLDLFHDVVRAVVGRALAEDEVRAAHATLAQRESEVVPRIRHLVGAGDTATAATLAIDAARGARERGAYGLEASLHEIVATHGALAERPSARRARAEALERAGSYAQAARAWHEVAQDEEVGAARADAGFREAHATLAAGDDGRGRARLDASLRLLGQGPLASGWLGRAVTGVRFVLGPARIGRARDAAAAVPSGHGVEVALMLAWKDPLACIDFAQRRRRAARHPADGAWCDALLSYLSFAATRERDDERQARRFESAARSRLALSSAPDLEAVAMLHGAASMAAMRAGRWDASVTEASEAARIVEGLGRARSHTHIAYLLNATGGLIWAERPLDATSALDALASRAHEGETAIRAHVRVIRVGLETLLGHFGRARAIADEIAAERPFDEPVSTFAALIDGMMAGYADVHTGDPIRSHQRVQRLLEGAAPMRPLAGIYGGAFAAFAALLAANARRAGAAVPIALLERYERLARSAVPFGHTGALRALAYARDQDDDRAECLRLLTKAEAEAVRWAQPVSLAIARYQRGLRTASEEGRELCQRAETDVLAVGADRRLLAEDLGRR